MSSRRSSTAVDGGKRYPTRSSSKKEKEKDEDFYPPSCYPPSRYPPNSSRSSRASHSSRSSRSSGSGSSRRNSTATAGGSSSNRSGTRSGSTTNNNSRRGSVIQKYLPLDPRPSKADQEERERRKQYEKEHGGFDWTDGIELALAGAVTLFGIEKALSKTEKK